MPTRLVLGLAPVGLAAALSLGFSGCDVTDRIEGPPNQPPAPATDPEPADGATGVQTVPVLRWSEGADPDGDSVTFEVYLGDAEPLPLIGTAGTGMFEVTEPLAPDIELSWRVTCRDSRDATTESDTWSFRTAPIPKNHPPSAPTDPDPADGSIEVLPGTWLSWSGGTDPDGDIVTFVVHLGTTSPPPPAATLAVRRYEPPSEFPSATTHFWQVVALDDAGGVTAGPIWSFTTNRPLPPPTDPDPSNGAAGVMHDVILHWSVGDDPDGDPVTFNVYFGTDDPPPFAGAVSQPSYDPPGTLDPMAIYYWRIVTTDGEGEETSGGTWMFITAP